MHMKPLRYKSGLFCQTAQDFLSAMLFGQHNIFEANIWKLTKLLQILSHKAVIPAWLPDLACNLASAVSGSHGRAVALLEGGAQLAMRLGSAEADSCLLTLLETCDATAITR